MEICGRHEVRVEFLCGEICRSEFGVDDGVDCRFTSVDEWLQLCARPRKPNRVFGRNIEEDVGIDEHHASVFPSRHEHHFIRREARRCAALRAFYPLLKARFFRRFVHRTKCEHFALREKLDIRSRQQVKPLTYVRRDGDLAFARNLHAVEDARNSRCTQAAKKWNANGPRSK